MPRARMNIRTSITHTLNVVEKRKGYWSSASSDNIVTKYVIQVSLVTAGSDGTAKVWRSTTVWATGARSVAGVSQTLKRTPGPSEDL